LIGNNYIKNLSKLGRNLKRVIIIDNVWDNFKLQQKNGIYIKTWDGDKQDTALLDLIPILIALVSKKVDDVRIALQRIRDKMFRLYLEGDQNPYKFINNYFNEEVRIIS
jgi:CTD small phosphatase-like protein 2